MEQTPLGNQRWKNMFPAHTFQQIVLAVLGDEFGVLLLLPPLLLLLLLQLLLVLLLRRRMAMSDDQSCDGGRSRSQ